MSDATQICELPLLQPAQAQKHITVNDAMMRLDGLVNLVLQSSTAASAPSPVVDGICYAVPGGAGGVWAGQGGRIAIGANGGWVFVKPQWGQRAFIRDMGAGAIWDGSVWVVGALTMGAFGAGVSARVLEAEVPIVAGTAFTSSVAVPANSLLIGITARVVQRITGSLTSFSIGTAGSANQFGSGLGTALNSWSQGLLSQPTGFYAAQNLRFSATGGNFESGRVRVAIHWLELRLPDPVA